METESLQIFWYIVIIASISAYAMLDGFDLGAGALHLFTKKDQERRIFLNAIGPVWDGNEVWLVIVVGALLAGYPFAYATLFSAMYIPLTVLIVGLIFRAVAIEFRSKLPSKWWRQMWDSFFFGASIIIALGVGIALGNFVHGIPLNENHDYTGGVILPFLHPYALLVGVLTLSLFMMHGAIFLVMKTEGELQEKLKGWITPTIIFFVITYAITTLVTIIYQEHMVERLRERPYLFIAVLLSVLAIAAIPRYTQKAKHGMAFIASCANTGLLMVLYAVGTFPVLIRSTIDPKNNSITVYNSSSSDATLIVLAIIVAIGIPLVIAYGFYIYRIFRGKVQIDHMSY